MISTRPFHNAMLVLVILAPLAACGLARQGAWQEALEYYSDGEYAEAIRKSEHVLAWGTASEEERANAYLLQARCHEKLGQSDQAIGLYTFVSRTFPESPQDYQARVALTRIEHPGKLPTMSPRIKPVAIVPTLCTLGNTFCGFLAIAKVADGLLHPELFAYNMQFAAWMIMLAMIFDALDGRLARMTKQTSEFGAQLDSLTDLITFGVAPAFMIKVLYDHVMSLQNIPYQDKFPLLLAVMYVICASLRLARFTLETEPDPKAHERFHGLPSPAAAGVLASLVILLFDSGSALRLEDPDRTRFVARLVIWLPLVLGLMMISRVEYVHLVSRWFRGRHPFVHLVGVLVVAFLAASWHETFFVAFAGYAVAGPVMAFAERMAGRRIFAPPDDDDEHHDKPGGTALVAIGSNLGDREANLAFGIAEVRALPDTIVTHISTPIETKPVGGPPQRRFLNAAVVLNTDLPPDELLQRLLAIETRRGRVRTVDDGPRVLDLDLVLFGGTICETAELTLPHPRFRERRFVLEPAAEVAPDMVDPVTGKTVRALFEALRAREAK